MLGWANQFNICCFLDNHQYQLNYSTVECVLAVGALDAVTANAGNAFAALDRFIKNNEGEWLFGHLGYDLKNETEKLQSNHADFIGFPDLFFLKPEIVLILRGDELLVGAHSNHDTIANAIMQGQAPNVFLGSDRLVQARFTRQEYLQTVERIRKHILRGDCYEMNFCQEFYIEDVSLHPLEVYRALCQESPNPFASYYRVHDRYLLCASPERYLKKTGSKIISQPIKGTSRRDLSDANNDENNRNALRHNPKDKAENIMIVDLVRNDLAKICEEGTVEVEELLGLYSFPQVHQMISTIRGILPANAEIAATLKAGFPMGSMTGAPKKRAMELVELYEKTRRGLFSGSVGYINPEGDFDFNVVIRSILYNAQSRYISFQAGSAITYHSLPEQEYDECVLKAAAIQKVLGAKAAYQQ